MADPQGGESSQEGPLAADTWFVQRRRRVRSEGYQEAKFNSQKQPHDKKRRQNDFQGTQAARRRPGWK